MKPAFNVEGTKGSYEEGCQQQQSRNSSRKWIVRSALFITLVVVVTGVVLGSVYFGMAVTWEHKKETWVQYTDDNGHLVDEKITVTDTEEDYETPSMRAIYDFDTMLITYKFTKDHSGNCYVDRLNTTIVDSPAKVYSNLTEGWDTTNGPRHHKNVRTSNIEVPREVLSPRGQEMCKFSKIYWLVEDTEHNQTRNKRRVAAELQSSHCCCSCGRCCSCGMNIRQSMDMSLVDAKGVGARAL